MLKDGMTYRAKNGTQHTIGGTCKDHPEWCWSLSGWWFVRATGEHVNYRRIVRPDRDGGESGEHFIQTDAPLTLKVQS